MMSFEQRGCRCNKTVDVDPHFHECIYTDNLERDQKHFCLLQNPTPSIRLITKKDLPKVHTIWKNYESRSACGWIFHLGRDLICYEHLLL